MRGYMRRKRAEGKIKHWKQHKLEKEERGLTNRITSVPLSTSKVVSIIAKDYITKHEKSQHNESTPTPKKELQR